MATLPEVVKFQQRGAGYWIATLREDGRELGTLYRHPEHPRKWVAVNANLSTLGWAPTREQGALALVAELYDAAADALAEAGATRIPDDFLARMDAARRHRLTIGPPTHGSPDSRVLADTFTRALGFG